jgi:NosR/NirI family nitrite reductase transcriptional regulator
MDFVKKRTNFATSMRLLALIMLAMAVFIPSAATGGLTRNANAPTVPTPQLVVQLSDAKMSAPFVRTEEGMPGWIVSSSSGVLGFIGSSREIAQTAGCSG